MYGSSGSLGNFLRKGAKKRACPSLSNVCFQVAALSPAEKFDIYNKRYDYPTVKTEFYRTSPQNPTWMVSFLFQLWLRVPVLLEL